MTKTKSLNPCELEIALLCRGVRVDAAVPPESLPSLHRTRAGLGSGLELILPGPLKDIWVNVPVEEPFARNSPYLLTRENGSLVLEDETSGMFYPIKALPEPAWYQKKTKKGTLMSRVGVLQGTYLGIYVSNTCHFWYTQPHPKNCGFCTTGKNVGINEERTKDIDDVIEVCRQAKEESGITFVHFNTGFHKQRRELDLIAPYVKAVKENVGLLVGVQATPSGDLSQYDRLIDLGADHFSFCYEFHNPEYFKKYCPGKAEQLGQKGFFDAIAYTSKKLGKGRASGEIIAGVEPIEDTLRAIDFITALGAFPTVCIFRPLAGSDMEHLPSPAYEEMVVVMRHMYEACRRRRIPIGLAPNIEVSLIVQPDDARYLANGGFAHWTYQAWLKTLKLFARPYFSRKLSPREN